MGKYLIDQYTLLHFAVGIIAYYWNISVWLILILHILFEYSENTQTGMSFINNYITMWPGGKPSADTFINSLGDTIATVLGWYFAKLIVYVFIQ